MKKKQKKLSFSGGQARSLKTHHDINHLHTKERNTNLTINKNRKNYNKFPSNNHSYLYNQKEGKYSVFYKNSQRNKMFNLFKGNTEHKLKALKIAEELADKSTLPILRKG